MSRSEDVCASTEGFGATLRRFGACRSPELEAAASSDDGEDEDAALLSLSRSRISRLLPSPPLLFPLPLPPPCTKSAGCKSDGGIPFALSSSCSLFFFFDTVTRVQLGDQCEADEVARLADAAAMSELSVVARADAAA